MGADGSVRSGAGAIPPIGTSTDCPAPNAAVDVVPRFVMIEAGRADSGEGVLKPDMAESDTRNGPVVTELRFWRSTLFVNVTEPSTVLVVAVRLVMVNANARLFSRNR